MQGKELVVFSGNQAGEMYLGVIETTDSGVINWGTLAD